MDTITISGLHKCQPKNVPEQGETKNMVVVNMPAKGDKKAWIKIKNELPDKGGTPYRILNVQPLDWPPDQYGNVAMNLEVEASSSQPTGFAKARETMQQGESPPGYDDETRTVNIVDGIIHPRSSENEPESPLARSNGEAGVTDARKHLMQSANLYNLCVDAVNKAIAPWMPEVAQTSEQFQAAVASLFIEASKEQWWSGKIVKPSLVDSMPTTPIKK